MLNFKRKREGVLVVNRLDSTGTYAKSEWMGNKEIRKSKTSIIFLLFTKEYHVWYVILLFTLN